MTSERSTRDDTSRACPVESVSQVYETGDELVVLLRLNGGLLELRVPRSAVPSPAPHHVKGMNTEATPC